MIGGPPYTSIFLPVKLLEFTDEEIADMDSEDPEQGRDARKVNTIARRANESIDNAMIARRRGER